MPRLNPVDLHTFNDVPQRTTVNGLSGWWTLPRQWTCEPFADGTNQLMARDESGTVRLCVLSDDGQTYAFQDPLRDKLFGYEP